MSPAELPGLHLSREQAAQMVAHCLRELPNEGCGLVIGHASGALATEIVPTRNAAASSRLYSVDSRDFLQADRRAEASGTAVIGVFHSHTHTDAFPSATDIDQAPDPSWHYVLVSLRFEVPSIRSYRITNGEVTEEAVIALD